VRHVLDLEVALNARTLGVAYFGLKEVFADRDFPLANGPLLYKADGNFDPQHYGLRDSLPASDQPLSQYLTRLKSVYYPREPFQQFVENAVVRCFIALMQEGLDLLLTAVACGTPVHDHDHVVARRLGLDKFASACRVADYLLMLIIGPSIGEGLIADEENWSEKADTRIEGFRLKFQSVGTPKSYERRDDRNSP
jgi:hypothetical protein